MDAPRFLAILLISSMLFLSFSHGLERVLITTETVDSAAKTEENSGKWRKMMEVMDYGDPEANTNPKYGNLLNPPSSPSVSAPSPTND